MISGVVLDMDGTLCDTETVWRDVGFAVADELGVELAVEVYLAIVGLPGEMGRLRMAELVTEDFPLDTWFRVTEERALAQCELGVPLKPGAVGSAAAAGCLTVLVPDLSPLPPDVRELCAHVVADLHSVADLVRRLTPSSVHETDLTP